MPDVREFQTVVEEAEQAARAGDFALADRRLREALRLQEASLGVDHPELASTLNNLAVVCETLGRFDDAERFYRRAYAIASGALPPGDPLVVTSRDNLKDFCTARGLPLDDWPGIGEFEAPATMPPPPMRSATAPAAPASPAAGTAPATPPAGPWSTRVVAAVVALAAVGLIVVATSWQSAVPPARAPEPRPAAAPTPPPSTNAPPAAAPAPDLPVAPAPAPAAVVEPPGQAAVAVAPPASPAAATPPAGVRVVVAELCRSLSTSGAWRCELLGASAAPGRAAFYTRIASPRPLRLEHRWYQGTALRQRVALSVGASPAEGYRTFSRQTLSAGAWRVELRTADGTVLHEAAVDVR